MSKWVAVFFVLCIALCARAQVRFSPAVSVSGAGPVFFAELNGDGRLDVISGQEVYLQQPNGSLTWKTTFADDSPSWIYTTSVMGDFNGDGKVDVLRCTNLWFGVGNGTFTYQGQVPIVFPSDYAHLRSGDFNSDGKLDLVRFGSFAEPSVQVWLGDGSGAFTRAASSNFMDCSWGKLGVADFNRDGVLDVVMHRGERHETNTVMVLTGKGDGTFTNVTSYARFGYDRAFVHVADLNLDSAPDVVVAGMYNQQAQVFLGGSNRLADSVSSGRNVSFTPFGLADVNGDGFEDQVIIHSAAGGSNALWVALARGDGTFATNEPPLLMNLGAAANGYFAVGDYNGDHRVDLAVATYSGVTVLTNHTRQFLPPVRLSGFTNGSPVLRSTVQSNVTYILQASEHLNSWTNIATLVTNRNATMRFPDATSSNATRRFYRLVR